MASDPVILKARDDGVVVITLNRPERRNPLTDGDLLEALLGAIVSVAADREARVLILTGAGTAFSAGGNVHDMKDRSGIFGGTPYEISESYARSVQRIPAALGSLDIPTIAAVNGPAYGAGCDMTLMCDLRVASETAAFGEVFVNLGLISGDGGTWFLVRHLGYQRAAEITLTGRVIQAEEALRLGLVLDVVAPGDLMGRTLALARRIAGQPLPALRMAKRLLKMAASSELPAFLNTAARIPGARPSQRRTRRSFGHDPARQSEAHRAQRSRTAEMTGSAASASASPSRFPTLIVSAAFSMASRART